MTLPNQNVPRSPLQVLDAAQPADYAFWLELWQAWPEREVFAHPAYLQLFQTPTDRVMCAAYKSPAGNVIYPFLIRDLEDQSFWRPLDGPAFDLTTPYGYGGPIAWDVMDRATLANQFWDEFDSWAARIGIVTEFARLTLDTESLIDNSAERSFRQHNVIRSLGPAEGELWAGFRHKVRKNVNHARRSGLRVEFDLCGERLDDFARIYGLTMDRRNAGSQFRFSLSFFRQLVASLPGQHAFVHAFAGDHIVSTELVLLSASRVYSWLGGTEESAFDLRPNDLLKFEVMLWAKNHGFQEFVLGGGATPDDGIFRYKLSFAPDGAREYFLRCRILDRARYDLFASRVAQRESLREDFFPAYRAA